MAWGLLMSTLTETSTLASAIRSSGNNAPDRELIVLLEVFSDSASSEQVAGSLHVDCLLGNFLGPLTLRADDIPNLCSFLTPSI